MARPVERKTQALFPAIRLMRDYLRSCGYQREVTNWEMRKARRLLGVDVSSRFGWRMRFGWAQRLREIGLDAESLEVLDEFRWNVALEMIHDPALERSFNIDEFRRRLTAARLAEQTPETAEQTSDRRQTLERFGIDLSE